MKTNEIIAKARRKSTVELQKSLEKDLPNEQREAIEFVLKSRGVEVISVQQIEKEIMDNQVENLKKEVVEVDEGEIPEAPVKNETIQEIDSIICKICEENKPEMVKQLYDIMKEKEVSELTSEEIESIKKLSKTKSKSKIKKEKTEKSEKVSEGKDKSLLKYIDFYNQNNITPEGVVGLKTKREKIIACIYGLKITKESTSELTGISVKHIKAILRKIK